MNPRRIVGIALTLGLAGCGQELPDLGGNGPGGLVMPSFTDGLDGLSSGPDRRLQTVRPSGYLPGRLILKARDHHAADLAIAKVQGRYQHEDPASGVLLVALPGGADVPAAVAEAAKVDGVEWAEPDFVMYAVEFLPSDPSFGQQWGLPKVQAPAAWDLGQGASGIKVAILDTGIDLDHEDLQGKIVASINLAGTSATADDRFGHGTHVAGIAAAMTHNAVGVAGVGFNASLMNVKVLGDNGSGSLYDVGRGIAWAADKGAKVINLSLGSAQGSRYLESQVNYASGKGALVIAAAGNSGSTQRFYPAYYGNAIAVGATDTADAKASFSNFGASWVDVAAPGVGIYSTLPNHATYLSANYGYPLNYGTLSGTSMATPMVAGQAALLAARNPDRTWIRSHIESTCDLVAGSGPSRNSYYRWGRVNVFRAMSKS